MEINITNKQYQSLIKLLYLGEFMVNGCRNIPDYIKEFEDIAQYLYSFADEYKCSAYIQSSDKEFFVTRKMEDDLSEYISDYDEECFWDELVHRLSRKRLINKIGIDKFKSLEISERIKLEDEYIEMYAEEINNNGIANIDIVNK